ncbi:MAG: C1 family peptidase [Ferruginibacter sp.]|nr:C1 family peptidase [Ferruginibacter sp.]
MAHIELVTNGKTKHVIKFKHKADKPDPRDYRIPARPTDLPALPKRIDLRAECPPVYEQGSISSCTANATAALLDVVRKRDNLPFLHPSRLFIYYNCRVLNGDPEADHGSTFRDALSTLYDTGVCAEADWDYDPTLLFQKPTDECYTKAIENKFQYYALIDQNETALKHCLNEGYPFIFSIILFSSFEEDHMLFETGILSVPNPDQPKPPVLGRHAVCCVGYDDDKQLFLVRNSFGAEWRGDGHFCIPYSFMLDPECNEGFWTLRTSGEWKTVQIS